MRNIYLQYVKGAPSRSFLKFRSGTHGLFEVWVGMLIGVGHRNVLIVGLVRIRLSMFFFECTSYDSYRQILVDYLK